jgi:hypothetical protein
VTTPLWLLITAAAVLAGYWTGRHRPGQRLDQWADAQVGGLHGARWWAAQAVMAIELAHLAAIHPRRTRTRLRESRRLPERAPAPAFDSQWVSNRRDHNQ